MRAASETFRSPSQSAKKHPYGRLTAPKASALPCSVGYCGNMASLEDLALPKSTPGLRRARSLPPGTRLHLPARALLSWGAHLHRAWRSYHGMCQFILKPCNIEFSCRPESDRYAPVGRTAFPSTKLHLGGQLQRFVRLPYAKYSANPRIPLSLV